MAKRNLMQGVIVAGLVLGGSFALKAAERSGALDPATGLRIFETAMGLTVAFYGNYLPKQIGPSRGQAADSALQRKLRLSGWAFTLAGLVYAALSAALPPEQSDMPAMIVMGAAVALTLIVSLGGKGRRTQS